MSEEYDEDFEDALDQIEEEEEQRGPAALIRGYAPMALLSVAMHLILLFIIALIPPTKQQEEPEVTVITVFEEPEEEEEEIEEIEKIELEPEPVEVEPVETMDPVEEEVVEVIEEPVEQLEDFSEDIMDLIPDEVSVVQDVSNLAVLGFSGGPSGASGLPSGYSKRSGKNKAKAIRTGGGSARTEAAVNAALRWLAEHQDPDGSWRAEKYEGKSHAVKYPGSTTGMALLPFLGAGHNEMAGKYKKTVKDGVRYINKLMEDKALFDKPQFGRNYGSGIVLMALAETSLFGSSPTTTKNAERIADYLIKQYIAKPGEGWLYSSGGNDFSVSGWIALGLKSAKAASLSVMNTPEAEQVFKQYKEWTDKVMTDPTTGKGRYRPSGFKHPSMMWVGMFAKQFLGFPRNDPFLRKAGENTIDYVKQATVVGGDTPGDVYQIYYGTLAAFQQGGEVWYAWNPAMVKTLVGSQLPGDPKQLGGSWNPTKGHTADVGGRVYTTAMMALCLEVYYRYDQMN